MSDLSDTLCVMAGNDVDNDLIVVLSYLCKRQVKMQEALRALGMSRSTYYEQKDKGTLTSIPNLIAAADYFGLNKFDLLIRFGHLNEADMFDLLQDRGMVEEIGGGDDADAHSPPAARTRVLIPRLPKPLNGTKARLDTPPM